jgi:hypothetical protein
MSRQKNVFAACRLCLQERDLRESHIIPRFIWRNSKVTGDKRKFDLKCLSDPNLNEPHRQDGFKEHLLCDECEGRFSRFENYARQKLFHPSGPLLKRPGGHFVWSGLDYTKLKIFQMSLLWRMGISTLPYYAHVNLGKHEEILRQMLRAENPGEPWRYGCIASLLSHAGEPMLGIFSQPHRNKLFGHWCYRLVLAGMHLYVIVSSHKPSPIEDCVFLSPSGTWPLFSREIFDFPHLREQVIELRRQTKESDQQ